MQQGFSPFLSVKNIIFRETPFISQGNSGCEYQSGA